MQCANDCRHPRPGVPPAEVARGPRGQFDACRASGRGREIVDCGLQLHERKDAARLARDPLLRIIGDSDSQRRQRSDQYRAERKHLAALLERLGDAIEPVHGASRAFERRSAPIRVAAAELRRLQPRAELTLGLLDITLSFAHMHVNRALRTDARVHELSLYGFLERVYTEQLARRRTHAPLRRG